MKCIASEPSTSGDDLDPSFMDCGSYCRALSGNKHVTLVCRGRSEDTQFGMAWNRNYEETFGTNGDQ